MLGTPSFYLASKIASFVSFDLETCSKIELWVLFASVIEKPDACR